MQSFFLDPLRPKASNNRKTPMRSFDGLVDRRRCGGTVWDKLSDADWNLYSMGKLVPYPIETTWVVSPIRSAVAVQTGSVEHMLCLCAYRGHEARIRSLLQHPHLGAADIHPAARADAFLFLKERHRLEALLIDSREARRYVCSLNPSHSNLDLVEQAQEFCELIETRATASAAVDECLREMQPA